MTYHPQPKEKGGSSTWFHNDDWLDFNMFQTGHCRNSNVYEKITHDYNLTPVKPTMDGEPIYEDHPVCFNANDLGYSAAYDVRRAATWICLLVLMATPMDATASGKCTPLAASQ
jgi:hypothetical protein